MFCLPLGFCYITEGILLSCLSKLGDAYEVFRVVLRDREVVRAVSVESCREMEQHRQHYYSGHSSASKVVPCKAKTNEMISKRVEHVTPRQTSHSRKQECKCYHTDVSKLTFQPQSDAFMSWNCSTKHERRQNQPSQCKNSGRHLHI